IGKLWNSPAYEPYAGHFEAGLKAALPEADEDQLDAVRLLTMAGGYGATSSASDYLEGPMRSGESRDAALLDLAWRRFVKSGLASGGRVAPDPLSPAGLIGDIEAGARLGRVGWTLRRCVPVMTDPRRTAEDVRRVRPMLAGVRHELEELAALRRRQHEAWRRDCHPRAQGAAAIERLVKFVDELLAIPEAAAKDDEWWLILRLALPDYHGASRLTTKIMVDDDWRQIASGCYKCLRHADSCYYTVTIPFGSATAPSAVRLEQHGYGGQGAAYFEILNRAGSLVPAAIRSCSGKVREPEALLRDDRLLAWFGHDDTLTTFMQPELGQAVSAVEVAVTAGVDLGVTRPVVRSTTR
ncbi:MAG: hypothetical protein PHR35_22540, partial [Kiritimatiellae bacterium]|nr:hypothetical protein [Kiritimatiellia bacterium]